MDVLFTYFQPENEVVRVGLTVKQQKFVDAFVELGNATQAALRAGYKPKAAAQQGAENLKKPYIKIAIDNRLAKIQSSKIADQTEVLEYLTRVLRGKEKETVVTPKGLVIDDVPPKISDRNKAAELIGKRHQMWTDNVNVNSGDIKITIGGDDDGD
ncbi:terminase small subunit [Loigolactobacillus coryniformis]|uniref:Terminase small subunit n=1 Tax=Loigolactobacillus coryniformis subsp. torquens DSM 20004 = KCTC 3535 TaxID=1423822 RepID=A0A2D1KMF2_9LACO|nr:terminase small subunit [Loigolactobacillus coryniformis]ATO43317.1 terminase small subunit [Loigolactobacillus coryniformis subsp. torquens DSM 20004 = KCTC 3535]